MPRHPLMLSALAACTPVALSYMQRAALPRNAVLTLASRERRTKAGPRAVATGDATENAPAISEYDHTAMEAKWQQHWEAQNTFATRRREGKEKKYVLDMFPYPSGAGLHVGHPEGYTASDIMARYWRMKDYDVLHPMGWDSFGLPAEQHAINTGTHPEETTKENIANFKRHSMLKSLGFSYDWERELATTDVGYVKWTQWIFLQLFKRGLAFQDKKLVNWCPELGTVLANEEIIDGLSERGSFPVVRMPLRQWVLKITAYADRLADDLEASGVDWPEGTKTAQENWIGRSEGAYVDFGVTPPAEGGAAAKALADDVIKVFTTRPDTLMGATYVVLAPEHPLVEKLAALGLPQEEALREYVGKAARMSDLDRTITKTKTGVFTGVEVAHPLTGAPVPIWVADYVLASYGTGAVMAVPAHDERDFEFATAYDLPIKVVVEAAKGGEAAAAAGEALETAFTEYGVSVNSGEGLDGLATEACKAAVISRLEGESKGESVTTFKLRDWVFSRQRYWGEPIPIVFPVTLDEAGGDPRQGAAHTIEYALAEAVPESELPVKLPELANFEPGDDPQGCLARCVDWRYFQKEDGAWWARETNTMPQWAGSCWYYLRFADPTNSEAGWSAEADQSWLPVDLYVGGAEHAVLHLLYARFWHKVLFDLDLVKDAEPFQKLVHQGMILGSDGEKMSKSRGNVVNPDDIVDQYGADAMRLYEMFMGPLEAVKPWQTEQISGVVRFQRRAFRLGKAAAEGGEAAEGMAMDEATQKIMHKTIKKVTADVDDMAFNTAISQLMVYSNHLQALDTAKALPAEPVRTLALLLSPFAPHLGEEIWQMLGGEGSLAYAPWPEYDEALCVEDEVTLAVQINGKMRAKFVTSKTAEEADVKAAVFAMAEVDKWVGGKELKKFVYVPGRIVNIVVGK